MRLAPRKRASWLLLLVLAAGLAVAGASAATGSQEMSCCPVEMGETRGCVWLGAADCCPERPSVCAPAQPATAPVAARPAPAFALLVPAPAWLPPLAPTLPSPTRTIVLRL